MVLGPSRLPVTSHGSLNYKVCQLGPPVVPFYPFFGEGSPTEIDKKRTKWVPGVSMTLQKWVHDPFILGNDPPFFKAHRDSR